MLLIQNLLSLTFLGQLKLLPEEFTPSSRCSTSVLKRRILLDQLQNIKHGLYNAEGIDTQFARLLYKRIKIDSRIGPVPLGIEPNIEDSLFCSGRTKSETVASIAVYNECEPSSKGLGYTRDYEFLRVPANTSRQLLLRNSLWKCQSRHLGSRAQRSSIGQRLLQRSCKLRAAVF